MRKSGSQNILFRTPESAKRKFVQQVFVSFVERGAVDEDLFLSSVTLAELLFGIGAMPTGRRKDTLANTLDRLLVELYSGRILPFDTDAARCYAQLATKARSAGNGFPMADGYVAAIASARGFMVAARDTSPFEAAGVPTINPWNPQA